MSSGSPAGHVSCDSEHGGFVKHGGNATWTIADQCPECRAAPGQAHAADCSVYEYVPDPRLQAEFDEDAAAWRERMRHARRDGDGAELPLELQEWLFGQLVGHACEMLDTLLDARLDILKLARERLREGYGRYGSEMWGWDAKTRRRNVVEELADAVVYLCSGPIA